MLSRRKPREPCCQRSRPHAKFATEPEKDWHVEERSYGSFYGSMSLPFTPADGALEAHLEKGVLHVTVKKFTEAASATRGVNATETVKSNGSRVPHPFFQLDLEFTLAQARRSAG